MKAWHGRPTWPAMVPKSRDEGRSRMTASTEVLREEPQTIYISNLTSGKPLMGETAVSGSCEP